MLKPTFIINIIELYFLMFGIDFKLIILFYTCKLVSYLNLNDQLFYLVEFNHIISMYLLRFVNLIEFISTAPAL